MSVQDKLMKARCRLMTREPWYGHVAMSMTWKASQMSGMDEKAKTMGVRIVNGGEVQCIYYPPFVESCTVEELYGVVQHEIEHIVRLHCVRPGQHRHPLLWNYAADMCVNGPQKSPRIGYRDHSSSQLVLPLNGNIIHIPPDWPQDETTEYYYEKLEAGAKQSAKGKLKSQQSGKGGGQGDEEGDNGQGEGKGGKGQGEGNGEGNGEGDGAGTGIGGELIDNHDIWNESDVSLDEARQVIKDIVDQATEKSQGHAPGHLASAIADLKKPVVKWHQLLQHYFGRHVGNKRVTYSRRARRRDQFGMPGISRHAAATVNVIVDTSGSVSDEELQQFFAEIESIQSRARTFVLQWDHAFQGFAPYRRGAWKRFKVCGRGGTDMAAPVKWLKDNHRIADCQIMLTDGECNYLPKGDVQFPMITVITRSNGGSEPDYGHVIRMK